MDYTAITEFILIFLSNLALLNAADNFTNIYTQAQEYEKAATALKKLTQLEPNAAIFQNHLGNVLKKLKQFEASEQAYLQALKHNPTFEEAYNNLGVLYFSQALLEKSERFYLKALAISPEYIDALYNLGLSYVKQSKASAAIKTFKKLLANYPNAFTYIWFHPKVGMWLGATPETLVQIKDNNFKTMSLAGTQVFNGTTNVSWHPKEIEEQQFVTDYITDKLISICNKTAKGTVETIKAGNLLHLKTMISAQLKPETALINFIDALHPTPAVCGLPKLLAKQFILKHENYNREFYTGFLGELNSFLTTLKNVLLQFPYFYVENEFHQKIK